MEIISGVYKITNTITGDFYIGSSKNVKQRWRSHKCKSVWKRQPNNQMYQDMQKYGLESFIFEVLEEAEEEKLKEKEQQFIEMLQPTYNSNRAKGWDFERRKESNKKYQKSEKRKKSNKEYEKTDKRKEYKRKYNNKYQKSDKYKESQKKYYNQLCFYNGETLTLNALRTRFMRQGITNPTLEAKKYLINTKQQQ